MANVPPTADQVNEYIKNLYRYLETGAGRHWTKDQKDFVRNWYYKCAYHGMIVYHPERQDALPQSALPKANPFYPEV